MRRHPAWTALLLLVAMALPSAAMSAGRAAAPGRWRQLGPDQLGYGEVLTLTADPTRPERVFAGLYGGGVARSGDGGRTWRTFGEGLASPSVHQIAVHPALGHLIYAVSSDLHRSVDDGRTWTVLPLTEAHLLALDPRAPDVVWAGGRRGLYRSTDRGDSWQRVQANLPAHYGVQSLAIDPVEPRRIYAGIYGFSGFGLWVSENGGRSWARRGRSLPTVLYADLHVARTVYFQRDGVIHRSRNAGRTWERFFGSRSTVVPEFEPRLLKADPRDPAAFYLIARLADSSIRLFHTRDAGRTWQLLDTGFAESVKPTALGVTVDGAVLLGAQFGYARFGVFRSEDAGATWEPASRGLINTAISALAVTRTGAIFIALPYNGVARSLDGGATWTTSLDLPYPQVTALVVAPPVSDTADTADTAGTVYAATRFQYGEQYHFAWRTTDNGETWQALPYPAVATASDTALNALGLAVDPADPRRLFVATDLDSSGLYESAGIFRSEDGGETWEKMEPAGPHHQVETHPGAAGRVLALSIFGLYRSTDHGDTWEQVLDSDSQCLERLAVAPSDPDVVYGLCEGTLLRSDDGGATFTSLGRRLPYGGQRAMVVDPLDPDTLVFQGGAGVVRLTLGRGRTVIDEGLIDLSVPVLLFDPNDPLHLFGGTSAAGLFDYRFEEAAGSGAPKEPPLP